jgi:hypothetical protein
LSFSGTKDLLNEVEQLHHPCGGAHGQVFVPERIHGKTEEGLNSDIRKNYQERQGQDKNT